LAKFDDSPAELVYGRLGIRGVDDQIELAVSSISFFNFLLVGQVEEFADEYHQISFLTA
jgi:hypothetical protein